eukprot:TRINITY_DN8165_c0_g1_i1.p1 TRINITY_DN8165_c0_g1~~TRINITY_DN8165_c0_g1_i1.p1  ORF type:complete len:403 (-),score=42.40 TRINITY_DN8165_c0_g1_i1:37-1245(-)
MKALRLGLERSRPLDWKLLAHTLSYNKTITDLQIDKVLNIMNPQPQAGDENAAVELFQSLATNNVLTALCAIEFNFSTQEMIALGEGLKHNRSLKELMLFCSYRYLRECDIGPLGDALKENHTLNDILLSRIILTNEHLQRLVDGLAVNKSITSLFWDVTLNCSPDPFFQYIETTQTLQNLDITVHETNEKIENALYSVLSSNKSLTVLKLSKNEFQSTNVGTILRNNKTITELSFNGKISPAAWQALEASLKANSTLTSLDLCLPWDFTPKFSEIFKQNTSRIRSFCTPRILNNDVLEVIKTSKNLKRIYAGSFIEPTNQTFFEQLRKALEENFMLTKIAIKGGGFDDIADRNYNLQKRHYEDTIVSIHVIARSALFAQLPVCRNLSRDLGLDLLPWFGLF